MEKMEPEEMRKVLDEALDLQQRNQGATREERIARFRRHRSDLYQMMNTGKLGVMFTFTSSWDVKPQRSSPSAGTLTDMLSRELQVIIHPCSLLDPRSLDCTLFRLLRSYRNKASTAVCSAVRFQRKVTFMKTICVTHALLLCLASEHVEACMDQGAVSFLSAVPGGNNTPRQASLWKDHRVSSLHGVQLCFSDGRPQWRTGACEETAAGIDGPVSLLFVLSAASHSSGHSSEAWHVLLKLELWTLPKHDVKLNY